MHRSKIVSILLLFIAFSVYSVQAATVTTISIPSKKMKQVIPATLILPDSYKNSTQRFPTVYLLHGAGDNHKAWSVKTEVAKLSDKYGIIFLCPDADRTSWYFDSPINPKSQYETFIAKECVEYVDKNYRTKANRNYRAICGVSMGGHGALFLSIRNKTVFSIAVALSGGVDIRPFSNKWGIKKRIGDIKTHKENWEKYTVINLSKKLKDTELAISIDCGEKDFFIGVNRALHKQLQEDGISHEYLEMPGGHGWVYWKEAIKRQISFIDKHFKRAKVKLNKTGSSEPADVSGKKLPRVLIIGDSISIGYTPYVTQMLKGKATVIHHKGNAGPTIRGMSKIDRWIGSTKWDVIHFNWGLWDMYGWKYMKQDRSPAAYEKRLNTLVLRLKRTGAKLIWGTTTPICSELELNYRKFKGKGIIDSAIELKYLNSAARVMEEHNIEVNDLHAFMSPKLKKYALATNNVHFTKDGYRELGKQVANAIEKSIKAEEKN